MKSLANTVSKKVKFIQLENLQEFLRGYTDIFSKNVLNSGDFTYKNLKSLMQDQNILIPNGGKDSSVVIMDKSDFKRFQNFLYRNFHNC